MAESKAVTDFRNFIEANALNVVPENAASIGAWQERNTQRYELYKAAYAELVAGGLNDVTATQQLQGIMADITQAKYAEQTQDMRLAAAKAESLRAYLTAGGKEEDFEALWVESLRDKQAEFVRKELDKHIAIKAIA